MHQRWAWLTSLAALACAPARVGDTAHTPTCGAPPVMELSAGTLDFGDIELGVPARGSFEVHNVVVADAGAAALGIDRLQGMVFDLGTATGGDVS